MKVHFSLTRRDLNVFIACLLSFSILMMPFVPIAAASDRTERRVSPEKSPQTGQVVATNAALPASLVATISATKSGAILNDDGDSKADPTDGNPGTTEKIEYTVTISNTGTTDATNVVFTDTIDAHTTLVDGSITTQPIAVNDTFSSIGNVGIQVPDGASDLLGNDCDPDPLGGPCTNTGLTISVLAGDNAAPFAGTSAQGGNVTATATDGSFTYNPAPGFEGSDSFTYTVTDATGKTDTATVNLTVSGMIWFVNAAAGGGGDGRLLSPFNCLVGAGCFQPVAADDPGDFIFMFSGTYNDNAVLALLNNQKLIGAAASAPLAGPGSITGFTIPAHSVALPATNTTSPIINSSASGIQLASGNLLRGFTVGNTATTANNYDIHNTTTATVGTLNILEVILNGTGGLFRADSGGALNVGFASASTSSAGSHGFRLANTTGSVAVAGAGLITGVAGSDVLIGGGTVSMTCSSSITHAAGANPMVSIGGGHTIGTVTFTGTLNASSGTGLLFDNADSTTSYNFNGATTLAGGDAGIDILNGSAGTFNFGGTTITNPSGVALNVSASSGAISISGAISKNTDGKMIDFDNYDTGTATISGNLSCTSICDGVEVTNDGTASGTVNFSGATKTLNTGASTAVNLNNNDSGNVNFTGGGLDIDTTSGNGFSATNGGTITVTGTGNSIFANGAGTALNVVTTTIGAGNLNFQLISAGTAAASAGAGIILDDTGASGGLIVTGNGGTCTSADQTGCSGGIIQNKNGANITDTGLPAAISGTTGTGVFLRSTRNVSLTRMHIHDFSNYGIFGSSVINFTLANSVVNGINGQDPNVHEAAVAFQNLTGSASVSSTVIQGGVNDNVRVINNTGTLDRLTFSNFTEGPMDLGNANGNDGMLIQAQGNSTIKLSILDSTLTSARGDILQFDLAASAAGSPTGDLIFRRNVVNNVHPFVVVGGGGITLSGGGFASSTPTLTYDIGGGAGNGNTFRGARGSALLVIFQTGAGSATGRIENNTFGVTGVSGSCSTEATCIEVRTEGRGAQTALVNNNIVQQYAGQGIYFEMDGINTAGSTGTIGQMNATVSNNIVREPVGPPSGTSSGIHFNFGASSGDTYVGCADVLNNTANNAGENDASSAGRDYTVRQRNSTTLRLPGYTGGPVDVAAVTSYIQGRNINGGTSSVFVQALVSAPGLGITNTVPAGTPCVQPPAAVVAAPETSDSTGEAAGELSSVTVKPSIPTAPSRVEGPSLLARATNAFVQFARDVQSMVEPTASAAEITTTTTPRVEVVASASNSTLRTTASKAKSVRSHHAVVKRQPVRTTEVKNRAASSSSAPAVTMAGETVTINIGTLRPADSVTLTFQVTVNNPPNLTGVPPGVAQVSNFGTVNFNDGATPLSANTNTVNTPVDLFNTTTSLVSDLNPSDFGDTVTFTATVAEDPAQPSVDPTGTVDFIDTSNGNAIVCDNVALSGGAAECQTSTLTPGTHNIRADYSGDGNFDPSQSNVVAQVVNACTQNPIVTSTADAGAGSLREALGDVCAGDTITFDIADAGPHTISLTTGELQVDTNVTIRNNSGESITVSGGGLSRVFNINPDTTAAIIGLTITGGQSATSGGGILNDGTLTIVNSTLTGNNTDIDGGAISNSGPAVLTLINTTISGNNAAGNGGGVVNLGGTLTSINSTVTNNFADSDNNTIGTGGGISHGSGTTTLHNTIVAGNFNEDGATDAADDIGGTVNSASSFNLIGTGGAGGLTNGVNNNQVAVADAGLGPLANNGGTTQTHALSPTSAAVETGGNANLPVDTFDLDGDANLAEALPVDQRGLGFPRNADSQDANTTQTVDIGAFELHPSIEDIADQSTDEDTVKNVPFNIGDDTGALIATVAATSSNTTLVPNANLVVSGSGGSRNLQITPAANLSGTTTITVTVTATNGRTATDTFELTVNAASDPPAGTDNTVSTPEDTAYTFAAADFGFTDSNDTPSNTFLAVKITTLPGLGTLTNNNVAVNAGDFIPVADINGGLLKFTPAQDGNGAPYTSFTFQVQDNGGGTDLDPTPNTMTINVTAVNDAPVNTVPGPQSTTEDTPKVFSSGNANQISVADVDAGSADIRVTLTATNGTITLATTAGLLFGAGDGTEDVTMTFDGTLTEVNTAMNGMSFNPAPDFTGSASLQIISNDLGNTGSGGPLSDTDTVNITVNEANDAPVVTTTAGNLAYTENDPPTAIDPGVTVTDIDSANLVGGTVAITSGFIAAQDTLAFTNQLGINGSYNSGTGVLTLTGTTSVANYQTALRSVTYQNSSDNPTASRTVSFVADDGNSTGSNTRGIAITAVNDAPVNTVPGAQSTNQNTPLVFSSGNGNQISVADADAGSADIRVTLTATNGTITLATTAGLLFGAGDGTADATMTFDGTLTEVNTAMNGISFTPTLGFSGAATLTITSNDLGNTGTGGPLSDTDVVNIQVATNISIQDAQLVEPESGSAEMLFTVTLSAPAPAGGASVDFTTQQQPAAINHATAGDDYTTTSGTVNFAAGEQVKTISVPILSDNKKNEVDETFLVVLSNPVNAQLADATATGTILVENQAGTVLISEFRSSGPAGAGDEFVEIYNNTDAPHVLTSDYGLFKMGASCSATPVLIGTIPAGTTIPARGHYLFVGSAYSLANYGGTGSAAGDATLTGDLGDGDNFALFNTTSVAGLSSISRLDAIGFGTNVGGICDLLREGTTLTPLLASVLEYSYFRDECGKKGNPSQFGACPTGGFVMDSNVNNNDFIFADTQATLTPAGQRLGAPGPQNLGSPRLNLSILTLLLDNTKGSSASPNRLRDTSAIGPNAATGTMSIRRRFVNNSGAPVTRLRFRVVDISAFPVSNPVADLRVLSSTAITVTGIQDSATCLASNGSAATPCTVTVQGTTLETPPAQPLGGAINSSLNAGTIVLATPLAPGASINLQFLLGVQSTGSFKFFFNIEALP